MKQTGGGWRGIALKVDAEFLVVKIDTYRSHRLSASQLAAVWLVGWLDRWSASGTSGVSTRGGAVEKPTYTHVSTRSITLTKPTDLQSQSIRL